MTANKSTEVRIQELVGFYTRELKRPLSFLEIVRGTDGAGSEVVIAALDVLSARHEFSVDSGFVTVPGGPDAIARTAQDFLLDRKWRRLLQLAPLFRHAPFVDAVFVSGSLALGNVTLISDFDLLVVVRPRRMFIARYVLLALAFLHGVRRRTDDPVAEADKLCLNHFVTRETWSKPPYNLYRRELYRNLVPVWGDPTIIHAFIEANRWCGRIDWLPNDFRWQGNNHSIFRKLLEAIGKGGFGNFAERSIARPIAMRRLARYLNRRSDGTGRVVVSDTELEFHLSLPYEVENV